MKLIYNKQNNGMIIPSLAERRCQAPDEKRPHSHRMGKTKRHTGGTAHALRIVSQGVV